MYLEYSAYFNLDEGGNMPIILKVDELEPGMQLAKNVMNNYSVLLAYDRILSDRDIAGLKRLMPDVGVHVKDPMLDSNVDFADDSKDYEVSQAARSRISKLASKVSGQLRDGVTLDGNNVAGLQDTIQETMDYILTNPVACAIIDKSGSWDDYLQEHCANVFYLSVLIGNTIKNYIKIERERLSAAKSLSNAFNLNPLALAAFLHDIGMTPIAYLYKKTDPLTEEEKELVRAHPAKGAEMLPDQVDAMTKLVIKTHHENMDGSGYPEGLEGKKINIFAKIVRVADAYSSAISDKIYRDARHPALVLNEMLNTSMSRFYDPVILKVFSGIVQPFPVGAKVLLEKGTWGVVVQYNDKKPFNPKIVEAFDEFGDPMPPDVMHQVKSLGCEDAYRVKSFGGVDMSELNNEDFDATINDEHFSNLMGFCYP